jgi:hypothetical protein
MTQAKLGCPSRRLKLTKGRIIKLFVMLLVSIFLFWFAFHQDYHLVVVGYCKGQTRYHGLPVDYWRARVGKYQKWYYNRPHDTTEELLGDLYHLTGVSLFPHEPLPAADRDLLPVLLALMTDTDPLVRSFAAQWLGSIQPPSEEALDALIAGLDDPDSSVRYHSMVSLGACGPAARKALPRIIQEFEHDKSRNTLTPARSPAEARLFEKEYVRRLRGLTSAQTLEQVDPDEARKRGL